ncbi:MAG: hydroxymethylglutaryl-CoA reductase, degradative, partial [Myxococcales bacterium]|nr:hydroxymethylglutaryl-CoA reductase, degradative [Myxococcales bacterium]
MTDVFVSAPGKAFLIGEYAILHGAPAIVTAVDVRAFAQAASRSGVETPIVRCTRAAVADALERDIPSLGPAPSVDTRAFAPGRRKLGLGSSAAVAACVAAYHLRRAKPDAPAETLRDEIFARAFDGHRAAQDGRGSGADVLASVYGGSLSVRLAGGRCAIESRPRADWLTIGFVDAGAPASTTSFVRAIEAARARDADAIEQGISQLTQASARFHAAFRPFAPGDVAAALYAELRAATLLHNDGLRQLQRAADVPIMTEAIETILAVATEFGLAAKPSGAGGGDLVVVFAHEPAALDRFAVALQREHGLALLRHLRPSAPGLRFEAREPATSRLAGFFKLDIAARRAAVAHAAGIEPTSFSSVDIGALGLESADNLIENVVGTLELPFAIATNFVVNGRDFLVPMCVEEASVVAAASNAAKMIRAGGGFVAHADPPWMIAQIQLARCRAGGLRAEEAAARITRERDALLELADRAHPRLRARGGGSRELEVRVLAEDMLVVHAIIDCRDAMGANLINTIAEELAPAIERITGWAAGLRILSNLADRRCSHVVARVPPSALCANLPSNEWTADAVVERVVAASRFAELDPYRAATHNKGIMNGVDAVILATGNDWRAIEAAAHAYAAQGGRYAPLAIWRKGADGWLEGRMSMPTAVGMVGGATKVHPAARLALDLLDCRSSAELGEVIVAAGLAANLAALRALATEGIQRG